MTLNEFYSHANFESKLNGLDGNVSVIAMQNSYGKEEPSYSCSVFHMGKSISSGLCANPQAAIESFRMEIKQHLISLNAKSQDIEL